MCANLNNISQISKHFISSTRPVLKFFVPSHNIPGHDQLLSKMRFRVWKGHAALFWSLRFEIFLFFLLSRVLLRFFYWTLTLPRKSIFFAIFLIKDNFFQNFFWSQKRHSKNFFGGCIFSCFTVFHWPETEVEDRALQLCQRSLHRGIFQTLITTGNCCP